MHVRESGTALSREGKVLWKPDPIGCGFLGPAEGTNGPGRGFSVGGHSRDTGMLCDGTTSGGAGGGKQCGSGGKAAAPRCGY